MTGTVLIVAKAPMAGRTKTRLVPPLSHDEAAALQTAMLLDTIDACRHECDRVALLHPAGDDDALRALVPGGIECVAQGGYGLAGALSTAIETHTESGPVLIVSSDIPGIPEGAIREVFEALADGCDVVFGPAADGGYWLIGMRHPHPEVFSRIPWSTPACLAVTLERCAEAGLRVHQVAEWRDVDTLLDLSLLAFAPLGPGGARTSAQIEDFVSARRVPPPPWRRPTGTGRLLLSTPWRSMLDDDLSEPDGSVSTYSYAAVPRAVFVVPVTTDGELLLVRQYRHPVRDWTLEVPAGSVADGESALEAARRELAEEVGGHGGQWRSLTTFYSSSAHLSLRSEAFLVTDVEVGTARPDADEDIEIVRMPVAEALLLSRTGGFAEGQTALAILLAAEHLQPAPTETMPTTTAKQGSR